MLVEANWMRARSVGSMRITSRGTVLALPLIRGSCITPEGSLPGVTGNVVIAGQDRAQRSVPGPKPCVGPSGRDQFGMRAAFHDPAGVEHQYLVDGAQGLQPMRDDQGAYARRSRQQVGGQRVGGRGVEVLGRLVEHQDREVGEQRTRATTSRCR